MNLSLITDNRTVSSMTSVEDNKSGIMYTFLTTVYICIFVIGVIGNCLVVLVILKDKKMRNVFNFYFISLSSADLLIILFCLPVALYELNFGREWTLGDFLCKLICTCFFFISKLIMVIILGKLKAFSVGFAVNVSYLTMLAIGVERFVVVTLPFKARSYCTKRTIRLITLSIWMICLVSSLPLAIASATGPRNFNKTTKENLTENYTTTRCFSYPKGFKWFFYFHIITFYVLPTIALSVIYFLITKKLGYCNSDKNFNDSDSRKISKSSIKTRNQLLILLAVVVATYFVCLLPFNTLIFISVWSPRSLTKIPENIQDVLLATAKILYFTSACINPIIYNLISSKFRAALCRLLGIKGNNTNRVNVANIFDRNFYSRRCEYQSLATQTAMIVKYYVVNDCVELS